MKKLFCLISLLALLVSGCSEEEMLRNGTSASGARVFTTSFENDESRTYLENGLYSRWTEGDRISLFDGSNLNLEYKFDGKTGDNGGTFSMVYKPEATGSTLNTNYAIYPYSKDIKISKDGLISTILPSEQHYAENSYGLGDNTMVAVTHNVYDMFLKFKNVGGSLKFKFYGDEVTIKSITLKGNNGEKLAGKASIVSGYDTTPTITMDEEATQLLTLNCGAGVRVGATEKTATEFWFVLPPTTFTKGFTITITDTNDGIFTKTTEKVIEIKRNTVQPLSAVKVETVIDWEAIYAMERAALIELYNATDGNNWINKNNWCSERPLNEWTGVSINKDGRVERLSFNFNNMKGAIPECIGKLAMLKSLDMYGCGIIGPLPESLADCKNFQSLELGNNPLTGAVIPEYWGQHMEKLEYLGIYNTDLGGELPKSIGGMKSLKNLFIPSNRITGTIPESIGGLTQLEELKLSGNLLTGSIPESMANLSNLKNFALHSNQFNGTIPKAFQETETWKNFWPDILDNNEFDISNVRFYGPSFKDVKTLDGQTISDDIYTKNKLTILCTWLEWAGTEYLDALKEMYAKYKDMGLEIICYSKERDINVIKDFMQKNSVEWTTFSVEENKDKFLLKNTFYPFANIIAPNGEIINTSVYSSIEEHFPKDLFIELEYDKYESTDYSKDGEVKKLQTATKGNGIDIILMGDAFCDREISDGTYDRVMNTAIEKFFEVEPYKSFRDHFNVYSVTTVSKHGIYGEHYGKKYEKYSESALDTYHLLGTSRTGGDDDKVLAYANKTGINNLSNSVIIVILNSPEYGGTCYMYTPFPDEIAFDWGQGLSISFFPMGENDEDLGQVLNHEAGGHGFAKLADEYAYQSNGAIPSEEIQNYKLEAKFGWWKNVDFTNELNQIKWYHFLRDDRYNKEGLWAYEGACTYWTGVWRPTEYSIMRYNTGGYNAPSREAIYYRIHKLAYGADWQYDFEKFVEYDAINRKSSKAAKVRNYVEKPRDFIPLHPPVIKRYPTRYMK